MSNRIRIGELNNQCHFLGRQEDVAFLASELRQLSEAELPAAIGTEVDRRLHSLLQRDGVYRIRRLRLNLALTRHDLSTRQLGGLLAERLVEALRIRLEQPANGDIAYFPSQADFIAQMMADLLLQETANLWMYEDYAALRHLSSIEAVVQLLLPRADQLRMLVAGIGRRNALATLLRMLNDEQAGRLLRQWSGQGIIAQFRAGVVPGCSDLRQLQSWLAATPLSTIDNDLPLTLATLRHLLLCLANSERHVSLETALWAVAHRVFVHRYRDLIAAALTDASAAAADAALSSTSPAPASTGVVAILQDLRQWTRAAPEHRDHVMGMLRQGRVKDIDATMAVAAKTPQQGVDSAHEKLLFSARAGLVLLLPVVISLRLHTCYSMTALRAALWAAGMEAGLQPAEESWLQALLPDLPQALPSGTLPPGWRLGLSAERQAAIDTLLQSGTVEQLLAQLLLAHFAARLSGLQHSSDAYLRSQFLHRGGYFIIDDIQIVARLDSIPLFIVLRMAGLAGWSDQLPWLQRPLTIDIAS